MNEDNRAVELTGIYALGLDAGVHFAEHRQALEAITRGLEAVVYTLEPLAGDPHVVIADALVGGLLAMLAHEGERLEQLSMTRELVATSLPAEGCEGSDVVHDEGADSL